MLTKEQKAKAVNLAMRFDIEGFETAYFKKFKRLLNKRPKFKGDLLNFYRSLSPMTQKVYLALTWDCDREFKNLQQDNLVKEFIGWVLAAGLLLGAAIAAWASLALIIVRFGGGI